MPNFTAVANPTFWPTRRIITNITKANPAVVTTSFAHGYLDGIYVRIYMPSNYGMTQINKLIGLVTVLTPTTFSVNINTTDFDAYAVPVVAEHQHNKTSEVVPIGGISSLCLAYKNILD